MSKKVLIVSAHPDDGEISCTSTILKMKSLNWEVWSIYFAACDEDPNNLGHLDDHREVIKHLGIDKLVGYRFPRNRLEENKQEIRDLLWNIKNAYHPDLILSPSIYDYHQDHKVVAECVSTIFRDSSSIVGFEVLRSSYFQPDLYLGFDTIQSKLDIISLYTSQFNREWFRIENFEAHAKFRGVQIARPYAEAYKVVCLRM